MHKASLNESAAAGLLNIALNEREGPTCIADPMCGSGTFLIEAALKLSKTPPGLFRKKTFPFLNWDWNFDQAVWKEILGSAEEGIIDLSEAGVSLVGNDVHEVGYTFRHSLTHKDQSEICICIEEEEDVPPSFWYIEID